MEKGIHKTKTNVVGNDAVINNENSQKKVENGNKSVKQYLEKYHVFYKNNILKKQKIILLIMLILFSLFFFDDNGNYNQNREMLNASGVYSGLSGLELSLEMMKKNSITAFLITASGLTPYFNIPIIGVLLFPINSALEMVMVASGDIQSFKTIPFAINILLQLVAYSISISTGLYFCKAFTMRYRYSSGGGLNINDVRIQYYQIRKNEEKLKKLTDSIEKKKEKMEGLNVNIEYLNIFISIILSSIIIVVASLVAII